MSGVAGSIPTTSGLKEKEHQKNQDVAKILREDLNERYEERIGRRYAAYKAEQEKLQIEKQGLNTDLQGKINIPDKHRDASSPANSAESRDHSKGRRISKRPKNQGKSDVENTSVTNKSKDLQLEEKIKGYMVSDTHKEMDEKFKRDYIEICEDLNNKEKEQREQEMSSENKIENEEQARRLQQLKRDQELAEFEEKGGFARILNNLFNPSDESIELDSVYQLKQLWKSYYETKSKISKDLIETLDALLNERPHAISMKKKSFYNEEDGK